MGTSVTHLDLRAVLPGADDTLPLAVEAPSGQATGGPQGERHPLQGRTPRHHNSMLQHRRQD